jgi:Ca-activated chloride channel family protein
MSGLPLALCKSAMRAALSGLRPVDTFNILTFSGRTVQAFARPRPANSETVSQAIAVVDGLEAAGGTYMADAVAKALSPAVEAGRRRYVFFLTDGYVGNEDAIIRAADRFVSAHDKRGQTARVFAFGTGSSVNRHLIEGLSRAGRGLAVYATSRWSRICAFHGASLRRATYFRKSCPTFSPAIRSFCTVACSARARESRRFAVEPATKTSRCP